jgi:hypothetical protein
VIIELPDNVDGFVPKSQLSFAPVSYIRDYFEPGDILPLKVVEFDKESKKIVLSAIECLRGKDQAIIDRYNKQHPVPNAEKYSAGSELPADVPVYTPGDKEIDEVIRQEFSYPVAPTDIVAATIEDTFFEKRAAELGLTFEELKEKIESEKSQYANHYNNYNHYNRIPGNSQQQYQPPPQQQPNDREPEPDEEQNTDTAKEKDKDVDTLF